MTSEAAVKQGLAFMTATFRAELDKPQVRAYVRALKDVPPDVLMDAAQLLIDEAAAGRKFYPMPLAPDWKGACAKVINQRRAVALKALGACAICDGTRWLEKEVDGVKRLTRCYCFVKLLADADAVGKPLSLPPARDDDE